MKAIARLAPCLLVMLVSACSTTPKDRAAPSPAPATEPPRAGGGGYYLDDGPGAATPVDPMQIPDAVARAEPLNPRANRPYVVFGQTYVPMTQLEPYRERGTATWYGRRYHGRRTSNGEPYDMYAMTAAHPRLPLPSYARVTNLSNSRSVIVRVNDRGPFLHGRVIDLSWTAAARLGFVNKGTAEVEVELITEFDEQGLGQTAAAGPARAVNGTPPAAPGEARTSSAAPRASPLPSLTLTTVSTAGLPEREAAGSAAQGGQGLPALQREIVIRDDDGPRVPPTIASTATARPGQAATQAPRAASAEPSSNTRGVFLQLGAFQSRANAEAARARHLKSLGWSDDKLTVRSEGHLHRVLAGPYTDRNEAISLTERIRASTGVQSFTVAR